MCIRDSQDTALLLEAMQDLETTQNNILPVIIPMSREETAQYVSDHLYPRYDAVSEALDTIITLSLIHICRMVGNSHRRDCLCHADNYFLPEGIPPEGAAPSRLK